MKTSSLKALGIFAGLLFSCHTLADTTPQYLMWQIPQGSAIQFPVYVFDGNTQVSYIPSAPAQVFAGPGSYNPSTTTRTYSLYYQNAGTWYGCDMVIQSGQIVLGQSCSGAEIKPPINRNGAVSNVWYIGPGATAFPAQNPPVTPVAPDYTNRAITFTNKTSYPIIQIGRSYCGIFPAPGQKCPKANRHATVNYQQIAKNASYTTPAIGAAGLNSSAFYVTALCTSVSGGGACTHWVDTGGYGPGQQPYATKIEPTFLPVNNGIPNGANNIDVSAVDGFNIGVKLYPTISNNKLSSDIYCTYTVPPENSTVLGAGIYDSDSPLAKITPTSSNALETLCKQSSQLPSDYTGPDQKWDLTLLSPQKIFEGCRSPCSYATLHKSDPGVGAETVNKFCCINDYHNSQCTSPNNQEPSVLASKSTYTTNILNSSEFYHVYPFAFGDAGSDYACPAETSYTVEFVSPSNITPPIITLQTPTLSTENLEWTAAVDLDDSAATFSYAVNVTPTSSISISGRTAALTGLIPNTPYTVTVTATENAGGKNAGAQATSSAVHFSTQAETFVMPTSVTHKDVTSNQATVSWDPAGSSHDFPNNRVTYTVNLNDAPFQSGIEDLSQQLTGLDPGTLYDATVDVCDAVTLGCSNPSSASTTFVTNPTLQPVTQIGETSATLTWAGDNENLNYTPNGIAGAHMTYTCNDGTCIGTLTGLTKNTGYTVYVTACDADDTSNCASSNPESFTTTNIPTITPFTLSFERRWWLPNYASMEVHWSPVVTCTGDPANGCDGVTPIPASAFTVVAVNSYLGRISPQAGTVQNPKTGKSYGNAYFGPYVSRFATYTVTVTVHYHGATLVVTGQSTQSPS
jgi:hypothetical protein